MKLAPLPQREPREVPTPVGTFSASYRADPRPGTDARSGEWQPVHSRVRSVLQAAGFLAPAP